ncbi:MAG: DMT family protein [Pseudomarimonas sp.]
MPNASWSAYLTPIALLICSNIFMTLAWYGHLKFKTVPLVMVIAISWLIALPEYALQVPANRMGHAVYSAVQLKTIQEVITLIVFAIFSVWYLGESIRWNHLAGFALIVLATWLIFLD